MTSSPATKAAGSPNPALPASLVPPPAGPLPRTAVDQPVRGLGWWAHPLVRFVAFVLLFALGAGSAVALAPDASASSWVFPAAQLVSSVLAYLLVVLLLERRRVPVELDPRRVAGLGWGLLLGTLVCLVVFLACWACGWRSVQGTNPQAPLVWPVLVMGVVAGVSEEIVFRGVLFRLVEAGIGTWGSVLVSALVFGGVHLGNPEATWWGAVAIALEAGVMFALLYALTRSLWVVIGVHAAWNVVQGPVLGSAVSGATGNGSGLLVTRPTGPELLSGGAFGLEASLVAVVVWLAVSLWVARRIVRDGAAVAPWWRRRTTVHPAPRQSSGTY